MVGWRLEIGDQRLVELIVTKPANAGFVYYGAWGWADPRGVPTNGPRCLDQCSASDSFARDAAVNFGRPLMIPLLKTGNITVRVTGTTPGLRCVFSPTKRAWGERVNVVVNYAHSGPKAKAFGQHTMDDGDLDNGDLCNNKL